MRARKHRRGSALATAALATGLCFSLAAPALAWKGDLEPEPLHALRQGARPAQQPAPNVQISAANAALCGKCHSACEDGRIHEGRSAAALPAGAELPLSADGRATCITCHAPHPDGEPLKGARLRVSNLQRGLCLVCHREGTEEGPAVRVVSPPERSIVQGERIALIGKISGPPQEGLFVRLNGLAFQLQPRGDEFLTWLTLADGVNVIELVREERVLWRGEVFHGVGTPAGYGRTTSAHGTNSREECLECHEDNGEKLLGDAGDSATLCYKCHDRFGGKRYLHGPLAVGACLTCHDPHGGYGAAHLRGDQTLLCGNCHAAREISVAKTCNASGKSCADCHDPHQSDTRYFLKGPKYTELSPGRGVPRR